MKTNPSSRSTRQLVARRQAYRGLSDQQVQNSKENLLGHSPQGRVGVRDGNTPVVLSICLYNSSSTNTPYNIQTPVAPLVGLSPKPTLAQIMLKDIVELLRMMFQLLALGLAPHIS